jgi:uncharacterized surface protein with fasciclin (FAS1) repeats
LELESRKSETDARPGNPQPDADSALGIGFPPNMNLAHRDDPRPSTGRLKDVCFEFPSCPMDHLKMHDIIDTAVANGSFTTFSAAVSAAGLVATLKGEGPFTVFAPNDDAFARLPEGAVAALLEDLPKLTSVLTYHVIAGTKIMAANVVPMDGKAAETVHGAKLRFSTFGGISLNNTTNVIKTDIECTNGVIHIVDNVINPPG